MQWCIRGARAPSRRRSRREVDVPQRLVARRAASRQVADELLERAPVAGRGQRDAVDVQVEVEAGSSSQAAPPSGPLVDRPLAEAREAVDEALAQDARARLQSSGSSNHRTELMTIRFVGRSMCSQAASALGIER